MTMLKWKETPDSDRTYQAPLILLPAELKRSSARSKIKIKQRDGEDPIFNATLIEFLQNDYEVDLSQFNEVLPTDESGVDVDLIWSVVREKIKAVLERSQPKNFSKLLIWTLTILKPFMGLGASMLAPSGLTTLRHAAWKSTVEEESIPGE